jgi:hypothetical protein
MICVIKDLSICSICCESGIDKNNKMVINPRGAIKTKGLAFNLKIFNTKNLMTKIPMVMSKANKILSGFKTSEMLIKNPKRIKNRARVKNANSVVISLNLCTSLLKLIG